MTYQSVGQPGSPRRYWHSLWVLAARDLRVRYSTSVLGYLWSILDPLLMSLIYWFVFTQVFQRGAGQAPYIVFLIVALLPWMWFNSSVSAFTGAFTKDAKLIRSTSIPRSIWVNRAILSKGLEFLFALPVLALFVIFAGGSVNWQIVWFPVGVLVQAVLLIGLGMLIAPLCVMYVDLSRTTALIMRMLFYGSPIIYSLDNLPAPMDTIMQFNPVAGIMTMYRVGFFPSVWNPIPVIISAVMAVVFLVLGLWVFRRLEPVVLKEL